jgi:hypothetical protein
MSGHRQSRKNGGKGYALAADVEGFESTFMEIGDWGMKKRERRSG